jgi:hypothetical protein
MDGLRWLTFYDLGIIDAMLEPYRLSPAAFRLYCHLLFKGAMHAPVPFDVDSILETCGMKPKDFHEALGSLWTKRLVKIGASLDRQESVIFLGEA